MRTIPFKSVLDAVLRRHSMDPRGDAISSDTALAATEHINARLKRAWFIWEWPEWTVSEERAFRQVWNEDHQYKRVNENGQPDEVFYMPHAADHTLENAAYYRVNPDASNDPPPGTRPPDVPPDMGTAPPPPPTQYWLRFIPDTYVAYDQVCRRRIGEMLDVYADNPVTTKPPRCLAHKPSEKGIQIYDAGGLLTVFIKYLMPAEQFTTAPYIPNRSYPRGEIVYLPSNTSGECYLAIAQADINHPPPDAAYWRHCLFPDVLAEYVKAGAYCDCLRESPSGEGADPTVLQRLALAEAEAEEELNRQINRLQAQGQTYQYLPFGVVIPGTPRAGGLGSTPGYVLQGGGPDYGPLVPTGNGSTTLTERCETEWGYIPPPPPPAPPLVLAAETGSVQLVSGQGYIDVVFDDPRPNANWLFTELLISNTVDANALNIGRGIVTNKTATGFRLQLIGIPDTSNYYLQWTINEVTTAPAPATSYILSGAASGAPGIPALFTVHLPSNTTVPAIVIITPNDGGAGGTFSPSSVGLTTAGPSAMFTYTAPSAGAKTISATNNGGLIDPASVTFTAAYATTYTLLGPSGGDAGTPSTNFTVALIAGTSVPGPVTVTPSAGGGGGTFTPASVVITTGAPSATFTYTPASPGAKTISVTNNGGLTNPGNLTYTVVDVPHLLNTLISYWKLDEASGTRNDSQGTNHLSDFGAVSFAGKINNAASFPGASQYLTIASNASLQVTGDFTFSAWVYMSSLGSGYQGILGKTAGGAADYLMLYDPASLGLLFQAGGVNATSGLLGAISTWYHIVGWFDSTDNKVRVRINDTTTFVSSTAGTLTQSAGAFSIGAMTGYSNIVGLIDEVGFWKRKLTAQEITALYNGGAGLPFSSFTT